MPQHPRTGNDIAEAGREGEEVVRRSTGTDRGSRRTQPQFAHRSFLKPFVLLAVTGASLMGLGGCGGLVLNQSATAGSLVATPSTLAFGTLPVGQSASQTESLVNSGQSPVVISSVSLTNNSFNLTDHLVLPMTLAAGGSLNLHVVFAPSSAGAVSADLQIGSTSPGQGSGMAIGLSGTGQAASAAAPLVSGLSCSSAAVTGSGTDACTVTLNEPAPSGGVSVALSSNNPSVTVPGSVNVTSSSNTATFSATVAAGSVAQSATLAASLNGASAGFTIQLNSAAVAFLTVSSSTISFGSTTVSTAVSQLLTVTSSGTAAVTISGITVSGAGFSSTGGAFPLTLNPGQTATLNIQFDPAATGFVTGQLAIASNSSSGATTVVALNGTGVTAPSTTALSSFSCASASFTGTGTDICTIGLNGPAPSTGFAVSLTSSSTAVNVPATAAVPANATTASFTASISAVTAAQTVTLQASGGGITKTVSLQLSAAVPVLSINATSISFGSVNLNTPSTQSVTLTSTGGLPVTVSGASVSGTGFSLTGATFPMTLNPGQSAVLSLQFDPTTSGSATGQLIIASNSSTSGTALIALSGTGQGVAHSVTLTWDAPVSSPDPVANYAVYRASGGSTSYQSLGSTPANQTTYVDNAVVSGQTYDYVVRSVDASGVQSSPSNVTAATIP
jgi:hypothetical protein